MKIFPNLLKEIHLVIALIAIISFGVLEVIQAVGKVHLFEDKLGFISLSLFLLATTLIAILYDNVNLREKQENQNNSLKKSLANIDEKIIGHRASIVAAGDKYLWDGFTGNYYVFNPSFRIDTTKEKKDRLIGVYLTRFKLPDFKAKYLFLTGDDDGKEAMNFFIERLKDVKKLLPKNFDINSKIEIKEIKERNASSDQEMYFGNWRSEMRAIYELRQSYHDDYHGRPDYYIVFEHQDIINSLIKMYFDPAWKNATKVKI